MAQIGLFGVFFDFCGYFRGLLFQLQTPEKTLFETFLRFRARRARTPVNGRSGRKPFDPTFLRMLLRPARLRTAPADACRMKDFQLPLHSRSFSSRIGVVSARKNFPCPSFPWLFLAFIKGNLKITKDFLPLPNPHKLSRKRQRKHQNDQGNSSSRIHQGKKKEKTRKRRTGLGHLRATMFVCDMLVLI